MLAELGVKDFALIDSLSIEFGPGLNVLSGETGAGKSILIGAISLLVGERATVEMIRGGCEQALVEGIVVPGSGLAARLEPLLEEAGIEPGNELILGRELFRSGRSVARVNGRAVPVSFLKKIGGLLVDLHGQHQHQSLLRPDEHLALLDASGGDTLKALKDKVADAFAGYERISRELLEIGSSGAERERKLDILRFQLEEIRAAAPREGEDRELLEEERFLANAEKVDELTALAYADLYTGNSSGSGSIFDRLGRTLERLGEAAESDKGLTPVLEILNSAAAQVEEASYQLRDYRAAFEYDPERLLAVQERLNRIRGLEKKYGPGLNGVLAFARKAEAEEERLVNSESLAAELSLELEKRARELDKAAAKLTAARKEAAERLEKELETTLARLALPEARINTAFLSREKPGRNGADTVEFFFSANRGEEARPLAKIISGGEVARVMLALKTVFARQDSVPVLIFDEIDSGIGGSTIRAVAEMLASLGYSHQVICVTHSAHIAAIADQHYSLFKSAEEERTKTYARKIEDEERRQELARMLDGSKTDQTGLQHVDTLLERVSQFRSTCHEGVNNN